MVKWNVDRNGKRNININSIKRSRWRLKRWHAEPPPQSQYPAKFSAHNSCESGDIKVHMALRVGAFHGKSASYPIQCPQAVCKWRNNTFILCHMTWQDHFIERSCKFIDGSMCPPSISPHMWKWIYFFVLWRDLVWPYA